MLSDQFTLSSLLRHHARARPEQPAYTHLLDGEGDARTLTWAAMDRRVDACAAALRRQVEPGARVLIILPPDLDYLVAILGCARAGVVAVPVYPPDPAHPAASRAQIQAVAEDAGVALGLTCHGLHALAEQTGVNVPWTCIDDFPAAEPWADAALADDLVVLLYTSGSTGTPKGVMLSHRNLLHAARAMSLDAGLDADTVGVLWLPLYHVSGLFSIIVLPLWNAARMVFFAPRLFVERPVRWLQAISRYRATLSGCPTFAYDLIVRHARAEDLAGLDLASLRAMVVGGEAVLAGVLDAFSDRLAPVGLRREALYTMFGLTEAAMISTGSGAGAGYRVYGIDGDALTEGRVLECAAGPGARVLVGSGHALPGVTVAVVDPASGAVLGEHAIGEIWIAGDSVALGYWQRPELTAATFDARTQDGTGPFLRTGDMGFWQAGQVHITGRLKEIIIIRGINHYPEDLEASLRRADSRLSQVSCAAFAIEQDGREVLAMAFEWPDDPGTLAAAIRRRIAADHGIQITLLATCPPGGLPRTVTGKLQRRRCAERLHQWTLVDSGQSAPSPAQPLPNNTLERLRHLIARRLQIAPEAVSLDHPPMALGLDSIQLVGLILDIRQASGLLLPVAHWYAAQSLTDLATFLDGTVTPDDHGDAAAQDALLPSSIRMDGGCSPRQPKAIFLTGVTGFLGGYLLRELLRDTDATLYCLVRAADAVTAQARLNQTLAAVGLEASVWAGRVLPVIGDLGASRFGLSLEDWQVLAEQVDAIYHNGAAVDFVAPYASLRAANVGATLECLRLASLGAGKALHFTSTLAVFNGPDRLHLDRLTEADHFPHPEQVRGGYARSKWVAEALLRQAAERGLSVTIHRAGFISGDSTTGRWNAEDFLSRLVKGSIQLGVYPDIDLDLAIAPVDWVGRAIVALSRPGLSGVSHLIAPAPVPLRQLMHWVNEHGYPLAPISYGRWLRLLRDALPSDNALYPVLPFLVEPVTSDGRPLIDLFLAPSRPVFDDHATRSRLVDLACPPLSAAQFSRSLDWLIQTGFLPRPSKP